VHDYLASRALPKRPQKQDSTAGQIQWLLRMVARRAAALIGPNPAGVGLCGAEDRAKMPGLGRQGRAVRWKRPAGSCGFLASAPQGLLRGIGLPPPGVMRLWDCCPRLREPRVSGVRITCKIFHIFSNGFLDKTKITFAYLTVPFHTLWMNFR
jgi:hypothetical protein